MGALLQRFARHGVRFELVGGDAFDAVGTVNDSLRGEIRAHKAAILVELRIESDARDTRRQCTDCRNLDDRGTCLAAFRGVPLGFDVPRIYYPADATLPQCCAGYLPFPDDPDQRPGVERWPTLLARALPKQSTGATNGKP